MAVCGYNEEMGDGIRTLCRGMYNEIKKKSLMEGVSLSSILERELIEIPEINRCISKSSEANLSAFFGLNELALPLFSMALERCVDGDLPVEEFDKIVERFINCLRRVEEKNLMMPYSGKGEDLSERARRLGVWIAENASDTIKVDV